MSALRKLARKVLPANVRMALGRRLEERLPHIVAPARFLQIIDNDRGVAVLIEREADAIVAADKFPNLLGIPEAQLMNWAKECYDDDRHAATRSARRWICGRPSDARVDVIAGAHGAVMLRLSVPATGTMTKGERLRASEEAARTLLAGQPTAPALRVAAESLAGAVAQVRCLDLDYDSAEAFLSACITQQRSVYLEMFRAAVALKRHGAPVADYVEQLLGADTNYFSDKFCARPFKDFEISPSGDVFICCPSYLPRSIGNVKLFGRNHIVNSGTAVKIRRSILDGKFTYCDWMKCPDIKNGALPKRRDVDDPAVRASIDENRATIDSPRHLRLSFDSTCNLYCPSCRNGMIVAKGREAAEVKRIADKVVRPLLDRVETVMMNGYGDVFSSRSCRRILEFVDERRYPNLKFNFITNGVLLTEQEWRKFPNIHRMVNSIRVSIDAATKQTYNRIRLGGDFMKLRNNLEFLARLRRDSVINEYSISFVVQRENFREMEPFLEWGERLGCDKVIFEVLQNWNTFSATEYMDRAVHLPDNPAYREFRAIAERIEARHRAAVTQGRSSPLSYDFGFVN